MAHKRLAIFGVAIRRGHSAWQPAVAIRLSPMLFQTFTDTLRQWRLLTLLFLLTLLPALPSALAFFSTLDSEFEGSLAPLQLLPGFNYTVFADFMHVHSGAVWPLIQAGWWTAVLSVLISVWTKGGILSSFDNGFRAVPFWQAATQYFSRYLRLLGITVFFVLVWLLFLLTTGVLIGLLLDEGFGDSFSERGYVAMAALAGLLFGVCLACILCISQYASVFLYQHEATTALQAYRQSWRFIRQHPKATLGRYLLLILFGIALTGVYLLLESLFNARNWFLIGFLFLLQQTVVFFRVVIHVWMLRVAYTTAGKLPQPVMQPVHKTPPVSPPIQPTTDLASSDDISLPL